MQSIPPLPQSHVTTIRHSHPDYSIEARIKKIDTFAHPIIAAPRVPRVDDMVAGEWSAATYDSKRTYAVKTIFFSPAGVDWDQVIAQAVESANGNIELS